jgi:hypothetical protein
MSNIIDNSQIMSYAAQAATVGAILDLSDVDVLAIQAVSTAQSGSSVLACYESCDGTNWVAISGLTETITTSNTDVIWHLSPVNGRYLKVLLTYASGAATFTVTITARNNTAQGQGAYVLPPVSVCAS